MSNLWIDTGGELCSVFTGFLSNHIKALLHNALFHLCSLFFLQFFHVLDTNMLVSKTRVETQKKNRKESVRKIKNVRIFFFITL